MLTHDSSTFQLVVGSVATNDWVDNMWEVKEADGIDLVGVTQIKAMVYSVDSATGNKVTPCHTPRFARAGTRFCAFWLCVIV